MPKKNHNINLIKITVSVHPVHTKRIEELLSNSDWGFSSQSDIVRQALSQFFRKVEPEYLKLNPLQEDKVAKFAEKQKFVQMSDENYARDVVKGLIISNTSGIPYIIMHWFGNAVQALPVAGCKEWLSTRLDILDNHLSLSKSLPLEEEIKKPSVQAELKRLYDIILPNEVKDERTDGEDS